MFKIQRFNKKILNTGLLLLFCLLVFPEYICAQSTAEEIESLLNTNSITYAQAARFTLEASGVLAVNPIEAFNTAIQRGWLPGNTSASDSARLDNICFLLMNSFNIKGGIMYSFFKNPRYAYREFLYMNIIQGRVDPMMNVSGDMLLFYINLLLIMSEQ